MSGLLPEEKRYWLLVPVTGLCSGLLSVGFVYLLRGMQAVWFYWGEGDDFLMAVRTSPLWLRILVPLVGGLVVAATTLFLGKNKSVPGTAGLIEALAFRKGHVPLLRSLSISTASLTAVAAGASLGREGALINSGAGLGSWIGRNFGLAEHHVKVLVACGAAAGIAAAYNVPIAASVFAMEVLLASFALELFGPIIICSVTATAVSRVLVSSDATYKVQAAVIEDSQVWLHVGGGILIGIAIGLVSAAFVNVFTSIDDLLRVPRLRLVKPIVVMLAVALVGLAYPALLGNGYDAVNEVLNPIGKFRVPLATLLLLPVLKILLTALCRAGGVPGGLFTPSLFVGALLGAGFGILLARALPGDHWPPHMYALLGMGAILAGTMKAPITAVLMVFELTRHYGVILPLMAAALASTLVAHLFQHGSIFTETLRKRGISMPGTAPPTWMHQPKLNEFINPNVDTVSAAERFEGVRDKFLGTPLEHDRLYVIAPDNRYLGVISLHEIKTFFRESEHLETVIAADILNASFPCVYADEPMSSAVKILSTSYAERLPVLDNPDQRHLLGTVAKKDLLAAYQERLEVQG